MTHSTPIMGTDHSPLVDNAIAIQAVFALRSTALRIATERRAEILHNGLNTILTFKILFDDKDR
jgi:hypothetical protein